MRSACCAIRFQVARARSDVRGSDLQVSMKPTQHGERRADLVRHVGHEVAPHGLGLFQRVMSRDSSSIARRHTGCSAPTSAPAAPACWHARHDHVVRRSPARQVGAEHRLAHQVADAAAGRAGVQAEMRRRRLVAPFDVAPVRPAAPRRWARPERGQNSAAAARWPPPAAPAGAAGGGCGSRPRPTGRAGQGRGCPMARSQRITRRPARTSSQAASRGDGDAPTSAPGPSKSPAWHRPAQPTGRNRNAPEHGLAKRECSGRAPHQAPQAAVWFALGGGEPVARAAHGLHHGARRRPGPRAGA